MALRKEELVASWQRCEMSRRFDVRRRGASESKARPEARTARLVRASMNSF